MVLHLADRVVGLVEKGFDLALRLTPQVTVNSALTANSSQSLRMAMLGGAGIALLPTYVVGADIAGAGAVHLLPDAQPVGPFGDQLYAVYLQNRFLPQKVRVFIDYLLEKIGDRPDWDTFLH